MYYIEQQFILIYYSFWRFNEWSSAEIINRKQFPCHSNSIVYKLYISRDNDKLPGNICLIFYTYIFLANYFVLGKKLYIHYYSIITLIKALWFFTF